MTAETIGPIDCRPVPACEDCATLGELCAACGFIIYGHPEDKGREGPCSTCPHPGEEHLFFSGLCTAEGCDCIEHQPKETP